MAPESTRNLLNDLFLSSRLQALLDAGLIEADGLRTTMRDYSVRLGTTHDVSPND